MKHTSKRTLHVFTCLILFSVSFSTTIIAQEKISPAAWRSDLQYFKQLIHSKYHNLFYNVTEKQFDSSIASIDKKIGTLSDVQMSVEFVKLVALFQIGHTAVRLRSGEGDKAIPWVRIIPVKFYLFTDGLFIKSIDPKYKEAVGGKIIRIGSTDAATALEKFRLVIAFENEQGYKSLLTYYLNIPEYLQAVGIIDDANKVSLTYQKDGDEKTIIIPAENMPAAVMHGPPPSSNWTDAYGGINLANSPLWLKEPAKLRYFEYLPATKTVYIKHSAVQDEPNETVADFFAKAFRFIDSNDVDKFVLDIRLNGGGNNYLNKSVITGIIQSKKINRKGHLFIITGRETFSAAQNLTNELEKYSEAIFVGEPTSENVNFYGDNRNEMLPNSKLNISLSYLWWQNMDPRDKRKWTAPQLAADLSFMDYKNGIDPAMNVIINYKPEASIDEQLTKLVKEGKYDEAIVVAKKYMQDPVHKYFKNDLETKVNDYGYRLMSQNKFEEANKILNMNIQLFPESANAFDSYAESWWKLGNKEEAIKYYNIAVAKDPNGVTGENSRKQLKEIQSNDGKKGF